MEDTGFLDFEMEDLNSPQALHKGPDRKKSANLIGLDELLHDHYQEKIKIVERESKKPRMYSSDSSDEEDDKRGKKREEQLSEFVSECERQVHNIAATIEVAPWGERIFGSQNSSPRLLVPGVDVCPLLQKLSENSELRLMTGLSAENGESFMVELLISGWLLNLILSRSHCDEFTVRWAFNLMAHSSTENVEMSACNFLCSIVLSGTEGSSSFCTLDWVPTYDQIKETVQIYGYLEDCMGDEQTLSEDKEDFEYDGPPENIRSWVKFVAACCRARKSRSILTTSEAENLAVMVTRFFLDRKLLCLSGILQECLSSIVNFFTDEEWLASSDIIAFSLSCSLPETNSNCLKLVESLSGLDVRIKELQKKVALHLLLSCMGKKEFTDVKQIIDLLTSFNVRDKQTDFIRMYICLALADVWLWCNPLVNENSIALETWLHFLRGCSCQISSTDWRAYASKVRNKASYLLQIYEGQR